MWFVVLIMVQNILIKLLKEICVSTPHLVPYYEQVPPITQNYKIISTLVCLLMKYGIETKNPG